MAFGESLKRFVFEEEDGEKIEKPTQPAAIGRDRFRYDQNVQ